MNLGGNCITCHNDKWTSPSLHLSSSFAAFTITHLRFNHLRSSHASSHLPLSTMAFPRSLICFPYSIGNSSLPLSANSLSEEEFSLTILGYGGGPLPSPALPLLFIFYVPSDSWVDYMHSGVNTGGLDQAVSLSSHRNILFAIRRPSFPISGNLIYLVNGGHYHRHFLSEGNIFLGY